MENIIIGIDPGSRITGYGVIKQTGQQLKYIASGCIKSQDDELAQRLHQIHSGVCDIIAQYQPSAAAVEDVFMHRNARSALKLGQARGVAILALARHGLSVSDYPPRLIKQAVVGYGSASKDQIQHMVRLLLNLKQNPQVDAADALAIAITHAHHNNYLSTLS